MEIVGQRYQFFVKLVPEFENDLLGYIVKQVILAVAGEPFDHKEKRYQRSYRVKHVHVAGDEYPVEYIFDYPHRRAGERREHGHAQHGYVEPLHVRLEIIQESFIDHNKTLLKIKN